MAVTCGKKEFGFRNTKNNYMLNATIYDVYVKFKFGGHGGRVVTLLLPTSEARARFPAWLQVGELVVAFCWSTVYSTEP